MLISGWQADEPISEQHIVILQLQAGNGKKTNRYELLTESRTDRENKSLCVFIKGQHAGLRGIKWRKIHIFLYYVYICV